MALPKPRTGRALAWHLSLALPCLILSACGGGGGGPAVQPQAAPVNAGGGSVSPTPSQQISWGAAPTLSLLGTATVTASASSGLAVRFSSLTPTVCTVDASSGLVTDQAPGNCQLAADQAGDAQHLAAPQVTLTLSVAIPSGMQAPGQPGAVAVTLGDQAGTVLLSAGSLDSGGSAITGYTIRLVRAGVVSPVGVQVSALPATVSCGGSCAGLAFTVSAHNILGEGPVSMATDILTRYEVVETFHEPDTQPRDSIFTGSFVFNHTKGEVTGLSGSLTESMTGDPTGPAPGYGMSTVPLSQQLSVLREDSLGGQLVTVFLLPTTDTFSTKFGGDGWSPGEGFGLYFGFPGATNPASGGVGNAYARIFVNTTDPTLPLTPAQIDKLAYADCTAGGMMGATCMTGTTVAGYGSIGTMSGYPVSQVVKRVK